MSENNQHDPAGAGNQGQGQQGAPGQQQQGQSNSVPLQYEAWLKEQPDEVKNLLDTNVKGLKSALESERGTRKDLEKQLRDLAKKAEAGSEAQKQLTELADKMSNADRRAAFYEAAHLAGASNLKLAFMVAEQDDLFDKQGRVNFETMKKDFPELFGMAKATTPPGNPGNGTQQPPKGANSINDAIRAAAGHKPNG